MHSRVFLSQLDDARIVGAIADAEAKSSGEIRVYITKNRVDDALREAKVHFLRLGMEKTKGRNAVLIYLAPRSRSFAVVGDVAVHQRCGEQFWVEVAASMEAQLRKEHYTDALLAVVERIGALLASHFPHQPDDRNELPNRIEGD